MKETLRYRYVRFPQIRLRLKNSPIGTIALKYTLPVILTVFRPSRSFVVRAMTCVMNVANIKCHAVRRMGYSDLKSAGSSAVFWRQHTEF